jgi:peroxin-3
VAVWEELKVEAFTRALGAAWLLPLLDLFVRVQLNILGRHLYLESAVEGRWVGLVGGGSALRMHML